MRHYRTSDSPSFRLVLNAAHDLVSAAPLRTTSSAVADLPQAKTVAASLQSQLARRGTADEVLAPLVEDVAAALAARLDLAAPALDRAAGRLTHEDTHGLGAVWAHLAGAIAGLARSNAEKTLGQVLMEVELGLCLMETWTRAAMVEAAPVEVR
jgi:hypothetical protein